MNMTEKFDIFEILFCLQSGSGDLFFPLLKSPVFSQVGFISKFLNLMIFYFFEFIEYFDDVKQKYNLTSLSRPYYKLSILYDFC